MIKANKNVDTSGLEPAIESDNEGDGFGFGFNNDDFAKKSDESNALSGDYELDGDSIDDDDENSDYSNEDRMSMPLDADEDDKLVEEKPLRDESEVEYGSSVYSDEDLDDDKY